MFKHNYRSNATGIAKHLYHICRIISTGGMMIESTGIILAQNYKRDKHLIVHLEMCEEVLNPC